MDSFSLSASNQIQFTIDGVPGLNYAVQSSTDLVNWDTISSTVISAFRFHGYEHRKPAAVLLSLPSTCHNFVTADISRRHLLNASANERQ